MAKQVIQLGTVVNDGTGDPLRTAFTKTNANFTELYTAIGTIPTDVSDLTDTESLLGGGSGDSLTNSTQTFSLNEDGNVVLSGETGGIDRGLVWDYGANNGGENSTVRQDNSGLSVRAWTEAGEGIYSAPVNIVTNEGENEKVWTFDGDGLLSLPDGGSITEGVVTDNPTIELTPASPDVASQKLVIKGGGGEFYNFENGISLGTNNNVWEVSDSASFYVYSETRANETLYWWIVPEESGVSTTMSGTVELNESGYGVFNFTVISDAYEFRVRVSPTEDTYNPESIGVESVLINGESPAYDDGHHLHLTTGDLSETSIFLGTDDHNVRTTTDGKIQITTPNTTNKVWEFDTEGSITFPDGSVQTTAFTGETISKYVAVNDSGVISGSVNGIDWNDYTSNLDGIGRVAVGPNKIVYTANSTADNDFESLWYADSYDTEPTEVSGMSEKDFSEVKYFKSISKFVAVGEGTNGPELHYSSDGVTWISSSIDPTYLTELTELDVSGEIYFSDISENSAGFFILSNKAAVGGFFLPNITDTMNADTHIDLSNVTDDDLDEISWVDSGDFIGWHLFITSEGTAWYVNDATDPTTQQFTDFGLPIQGVLEDNIGTSSGTTEIVVGEYNRVTTVMVATGSGQIVYWPAIPNGPFVSIPKPYTASISEWSDSATSAITYTGETGSQGGERFVVSGSSVGDYNGTYYLGEGNAVFTDDELTVPFDTTGLTAFTGSATITWSHGQYIDALHYSDGIFYAGNDSEEMFISTNGGETWTQTDQLLGGQGESDGYINDIDSYVSVGISANTGEFSFNSNTVTVADQDMQFRTTRAGFDVDADFDVESAEDVRIDALGDTVSIAAANNVTITTGTLNMYPTVWEGNEENFIGTWNGTTVSLIVPSSDTTIITLLDHYVETDDAPIWIRTASGYVETDTSDVATKTVDGNVTEYEIPVYATSPTTDANIISMKLYDSITNFGEKEFEFTKDGKLAFPSGGTIEPVGMGWLGVTNGTSGNPVSILAKGYEGTERAAVTLYNSGTYGTAELYTVNAPGIVQTGNRNTTFSSGSWDANPKTALATTGGSGTGLTVDVNEDGSGYADFVTIVNPGTGYVNGEAITVTSGSSNATFTIVVEEQFNNWTFDQEGRTQLPGTLTFPDTSIQTTAYAPVTGEWTLPDDTTEVYSFTLPSDGTYTMWVKCNIPNGIIVWNATASVSNSNVPAIGQQYAWNYTGGGSPILLTAIPNQIRGTAGTISTDATYAGTTSNRFDFTIANTSGASQTVYYGYTKV